MNKPRIPLIYILSNGRSGSTLLDLLLGSHPNIWTLGEAQRLPLEWEADTSCGCGVPLTSCAFWGSVIPEIPLNEKNYPIEHFRTNEGQGRILHWGLLPGLLSGITSPEQKKAMTAYGQVNAEYLNAVLKAASRWGAGNDIHWLVDASKDAYRFFWLQKSGLFDLKVIHLLKSPPAFVYSMIKRDLSIPKKKVFRMTVRWVVENYIGLHLRNVHFPKAQSILLHYEELASQPEATMMRIGNWLGLDFTPEFVHGFRKYENHAVSGNQMRWQEAEISLDEKWRTMLPASYQHVINIFTMPFRRMFGYE